MTSSPGITASREGRILSFGGNLYEAAERKFRETILLTPFYGARRSQLRRHIQFLNEIGFNVVTYDLINEISSNIFSADGKFGYKHIWADQVEKILSEIDGDKIVFALSNVAAGAIEAIARRRASDVRALVCDSGPSGHFSLSAWNLIGHHLGEKSVAKRILKTAFARFIWSLSPRPIARDLEAFPTDFPVLAIAGTEDVLISEFQINAAFGSHSQLKFKMLALPRVGHIEGLKRSSDQYCAGVVAFLEAYARLLIVPE